MIGAIEQLTDEAVDISTESTDGYDLSELAIPHELEGLTIDTIEIDETWLTWQTYETYDETTFLIQAEVDAHISLVGFAYKADAVYLEEGKRSTPSTGTGTSTVAHVAVSTTGHLVFQVRVEQGANHAEECELEGVVAISTEGDDDHPWRKSQ